MVVREPAQAAIRASSSSTATPAAGIDEMAIGIGIIVVAFLRQVPARNVAVARLG
jgi:hypothetical protein